MKAMSVEKFGGPDVLTLVEMPEPEPGPTEVLVRVHAAGVNPVDVKTRSGGGMAYVLGDPPFGLGWDVSGTVEEIGFGVSTLRPGDEVFGMPWFPRAAGGYGQFVTGPSRHFAPKPPGLSYEEAAALPLAGLTAWQILAETAHVEPGQHVLVHAAAGGVGHLAVQIAKALGARVTATARAEKHDFLRRLGADETVDYTAGPVEDAVGDVDVVVDLVGGVAHELRSLQVLRRGGLLVPVPGGLDPRVAEEARARGMRVTEFLVEPDRSGLRELARLVADGRLAVELADVLPLADAAEAHRRLGTGRTRGKLVLSVDH
jgi:NADPH:quinone reductase-like Zn-dependent oxidoreductase